MAKNTQLSNLAVNTEADTLAALANGGFLKLYDGTQPLTGDDAITTQIMLVALVMGNPAFAPADAGVLIANAITGVLAVATGVAAWFRLTRSNGVAIWDGSVGTANANVIVPSTTVTVGVLYRCSTFTHTVYKNSTGY